MTQPLPRRKDLALFSELVKAGPSNPDRMVQLTWQARSLANQEPDNPVARVAHAAALICSGNRDKGVEELEAAYVLGRHATPAVRDMLASLLYFVGDYKRAGEVYHEIMTESGLRAIYEFRAKAVEYAVASGDWELLELLVAAKVALADLIVGLLEKNGLHETLREHQGVIHDAIGDRQCQVQLSILPDESNAAEDITVFVQHLVLADREERRELMRKIDEGLRALYASKGMNPIAYVGHLEFDILPMPVAKGGAVAA